MNYELGSGEWEVGRPLRVRCGGRVNNSNLLNSEVKIETSEF
ncbi:hypothetical protein VL20_953 [Microcystis panniformis FACHB-1757]|uniref:Uncharacterized protein n=1 Tax=Microcystis panniformis FACHB-1757 TaxID=1638788 RepID=A0A0K1RW70_9CHRO|nr:hypothetical protein VL20_953 [Microcystis panniformis FACHB-1757]